MWDESCGFQVLIVYQIDPAKATETLHSECPHFPQPLRIQTPSVWRVLGSYRSQVMQLYAYHIDVKQFQPHFLIFFGQKKIPSPSITIHGCRWCLGSSYSRTTTTIRRHLGCLHRLLYDGKHEGLKMTQMERITEKFPAENCSSILSSSSSTPNGETQIKSVGLKSFFLRAGTGICPNFPRSSHLDVRVKAQK